MTLDEARAQIGNVVDWIYSPESGHSRLATIDGISKRTGKVVIYTLSSIRRGRYTRRLVDAGELRARQRG